MIDLLGLIDLNLIHVVDMLCLLVLAVALGAVSISVRLWAICEQLKKLNRNFDAKP
jgi:hypothetical protein